MNILHLLPCSESEKLYYILLSEVAVDLDTSRAYSTVSLLKIEKYFEKSVIELLEELKAQEKVKLKKIGHRKYQVYVGLSQGDKKILLYPLQETINGITKLDSYAVKTSKTNFNDVYCECWELYSRALYLTNKEVSEFYQKTHHLVNQQECRNFTSKEYGQIKNLLKLFSVKDALDMIIEFFVNGQEYYKYPAVSLFIYHKDALYGKIKNLNIKVQQRKRETNNESEHF